MYSFMSKAYEIFFQIFLQPGGQAPVAAWLAWLHDAGRVVSIMYASACVPTCRTARHCQSQAATGAWPPGSQRRRHVKGAASVCASVFLPSSRGFRRDTTGRNLTEKRPRRESQGGRRSRKRDWLATSANALTPRHEDLESGTWARDHPSGGNLYPIETASCSGRIGHGVFYP